MLNINYKQGITDVAFRVALPIRFPESRSCAGERCCATRGEWWQRQSAARGGVGPSCVSACVWILWAAREPVSRRAS